MSIQRSRDHRRSAGAGMSIEHDPLCRYGGDPAFAHLTYCEICAAFTVVRKDQDKKSRADERQQARLAGLRAARHAVAMRLTQMGYDTEDTNPYLAAIDALIHDAAAAGGDV